MILLLSSLSLAATHQVSFSLSVDQAVAMAVSGDEIQVPAGEWPAHADASGKDLRIVGEEGAILSSDTGETTIWATSGSLDVDGLRFEGAGRALYMGSGTLSLNQVVIDGGRGDWGSQVNVNGATLNIVDSSFFSGLSLYDGGSIYAQASVVDIQGSLFDENSADENGGAIALYSGSTLSLTDTEFVVNESAANGGALYLSGSTADLGNASFSGNAIYDGYGGAIYLVESTITGNGVQFTDNEATYGYGGAIYGETNVGVTFENCTFEGNNAYRNAGQIGMYYAYGPLSLTGCTVTDGASSQGHGGGIFAYAWVDISLIDTVISGNTARYHGGGLYQYYYGSTTIQNSEISSNKSKDYSGGGAYLYYIWTGSSILIQDSVIANNKATLEGGGLWLRYTAKLALERVDLLDNGGEEGLYGGGIFMSDAQTATVHETRLAGNTATYGGGFYATATSVAADWSNVLVQENLARIGGGGCWVASELLTATNMSFLGNQAFDAGSALCLYETHGEFTNLLFSGNLGAAAIHAEDTDSGFYSTFKYSAFVDNEAGHLSGALLPEELEETGNQTDLDAGMMGWSPDGDWVNDHIVLSPSSPLIDAGDPALLDADGTRSDIGHHGGPLDILADADGDGWDTRYDCDDTDPNVNPDATEIWYDGVDGDCRGDSDLDQDGDGENTQDFGGEDCDDTDPNVIVCEETDSDTGGNSDSDAPQDPKDCGGCGGGLGGGLWALGLAAMMRRRL
ncbi:MAG: putative outer membrane repeat protein [Cognaticolwellia sp.]|jgi:predicted outer membrane repeat protein